jgi:hypothetical protein
MAVPTELLPTTFDVYRPFGAGSPTVSGVAGRLVGDFARGRQATAPAWTHYLEVSSDTDVRDGCTRTAGSPGPVYADGDEVRVPGGTRFVVVWVETVDAGTPREFKRAYLARHTA